MNVSFMSKNLQFQSGLSVFIKKKYILNDVMIKIPFPELNCTKLPFSFIYFHFQDILQIDFHLIVSYSLI